MLSASTAFIFPRAWELDGFGMTTIEAMALGVPIVTTNFGPQIEIVKDGIDGFRYKPHDSNDLAKKLEQIVTLSAAKRNSMKKASLERVKAFADNISHQKMLEIIQKYG
jgi:glycosyltransferase involved in cell wall biosynthesis